MGLSEIADLMAKLLVSKKDGSRHYLGYRAMTLQPNY